MAQFSEAALRLAPWSVTKIKSAKKCPFRAAKTYVEREEEKWDASMDNSSAAVGVKIHAFMELMLEHFPKDQFPDDVALNKLGIIMLRKVLDDNDLTINERDSIENLYDSSVMLCQRLLAHVYSSPGMQTFIESELAVDKDLQPVEYKSPESFFMGKLDFLMVSRTGAAGLLDHKTSQWATLNGQSLQLRSYEVLVLCSLKNKLKEDYNIHLSSFASGVVFNATNEIKWDASQTAEKVETSGVSAFVELVNGVAEEVDKQTIRRGNHCLQCGYKHLCGSRRGMGKKKAVTVAL